MQFQHPGRARAASAARRRRSRRAARVRRRHRANARRRRPAAETALGACRRDSRTRSAASAAASRSSSDGQRDEAIGQMIAHRTREEFGAPPRETGEHRLPTAARALRPASHSPSSCRISVSASACAMLSIAAPGAVGEAVAVERRLERALAALARPRFGALPEPALQRFQPHVDRAVARRGRRRGQVARIFAAGDEDAHAVAPFLALERAQEELRLAEAADAGAVDKPLSDQRLDWRARRRTDRRANASSGSGTCAASPATSTAPRAAPSRHRHLPAATGAPSAMPRSQR